MKTFDLPDKPCITKQLRLNGGNETVIPAEIISLNEVVLKEIIKKTVQEEMCMTVEDFLSRRTRQLLLDANAAIKIAPSIATLLADEMKKSENWINEQINNFNDVAINYIPTINHKQQTKN